MATGTLAETHSLNFPRRALLALLALESTGVGDTALAQWSLASADRTCANRWIQRSLIAEAFQTLTWHRQITLHELPRMFQSL